MLFPVILGLWRVCESTDDAFVCHDLHKCCRAAMVAAGCLATKEDTSNAADTFDRANDCTDCAEKHQAALVKKGCPTAKFESTCWQHLDPTPAPTAVPTKAPTATYAPTIAPSQAPTPVPTQSQKSLMKRQTACDVSFKGLAKDVLTASNEICPDLYGHLVNCSETCETRIEKKIGTKFRFKWWEKSCGKEIWRCVFVLQQYSKPFVSNNTRNLLCLLLLLFITAVQSRY